MKKMQHGTNSSYIPSAIISQSIHNVFIQIHFTAYCINHNWLLINSLKLSSVMTKQRRNEPSTPLIYCFYTVKAKVNVQ